jgi:energy-coupling factor transporter ATP-binding protein EcfA2
MDEHEINLEIPTMDDEGDEITFYPKSLPDDLFNLLERFTRIPKGQWILRFICAYELLPLYGSHGKVFLKSTPILFTYGRSGSGKSTLGAILQRLNPQATGDIAGISAGSNYKGWEQKLKDFRYYSSGKQKSFPLMSIDDLTPECFNGMVGDLRLNFLKQVVVHTGSFVKGGIEGTPITIEAYCKIVCSSISDIPTYEGLAELERRMIRIQTKKIEDWEESDYWGISLLNPLEEHTEFKFSETYDECKYLYFNSIAIDFVKTIQKVKRIIKKDFNESFPLNRVEIFAPMIALCSIMFEEKEENCIQEFINSFLSIETVKAESNLSKIIKAFLASTNYPHVKRELAYCRFGAGYEVSLKEISSFLNVKMQEKEVTKGQCNREAITAVMSDLGFTVSIDDTSTIYQKLDVDRKTSDE